MASSVRKADLKGLKAAKLATTMTKEEWKKKQVGMKEKWPQPEYMKNENPEGKGHNCYRDETFQLVTRCMAKTKISYRPHAKAPGSKSHVRYEKYSVAQNLGDSFKMGSWPADWCWDIERGYLKVHGPLRDEPLDITQVSDTRTLTDVDTAVVQWYKKELCKKYDLDMKVLSASNSGENMIMRAHRLNAQREAKKILEDCRKKNRMVSEADMTSVLTKWGFARNVTRVNVMKEGMQFVWSDTLGLLRDRVGDIHLTNNTKGYPEVVQVFSKWLTDRLPPEASSFKWTSFNVNKDYATKIHRDGNNFGPSMISAFGEFSGGELNYYPHDDCKIDLGKLEATTKKKAEQLDLGNGLALFNGNSAHSVEDFEGNRFSIVFFCLGCHAKMKKEDRVELAKLGLNVPHPEESPYKVIRPPLGERAALRYKDLPTPSKETLPAFRYWPKDKLERGKKRKHA